MIVPLNEYVFSPGARFNGSSTVFANSNSKPIRITLMPIAKPLTDRDFGVAFRPKKPVRSADAVAGAARVTRSAIELAASRRFIQFIIGSTFSRNTAQREHMKTCRHEGCMKDISQS